MIIRNIKDIDINGLKILFSISFTSLLSYKNNLGPLAKVVHFIGSRLIYTTSFDAKNKSMRCRWSLMYKYSKRNQQTRLQDNGD